MNSIHSLLPPPLLLLLLLNVATTSLALVGATNVNPGGPSDFILNGFCTSRASKADYWNKKYGTESQIACLGSCLPVSDVASKLAWCGGVVAGYDDGTGQYVCVRNLTNATYAGETEDESMKRLDDDAQDCSTREGKNAESGFTGTSFDCANSLKLGSCHFAFPKCSPASVGVRQPLAICKSFCANERKACRTLQSGRGHSEAIEAGCTGPDWVDAVGPSDKCTSASPALAAPASSVFLSLIALGLVCVGVVLGEE